MKLYLYSLLTSFLLTASIQAQVVTVSTLTTGLSRPVCVTNSGLPNDDRLFVIEKIGRIRMVNRVTGALNPNNFLSIQGMVATGNEQGLLGLAFHPDYANNRYFFINYTNNAGHTVIARYEASPTNPDSGVASTAQILMTIYQPFSNHNGGNLMFGWDGYLYISMGDGGSGGDPQNNGQNIDSLLGKVLRIDVNNPNPPYYFIPTTNPFYGPTAGRDEIWSYGWRNPWRCSIDRMTGDKWFGDVGQVTYEEIDFESLCDAGGRNYGWRCYEGNLPYPPAACTLANATYPVFVYSHSLGCSVTGGYVYRGGQEGALFSKYLSADYCSGRIWATFPDGNGGWTTNLLTQTNSLNTNRYSSWGEDIYGELYLCGDGASGLLYKIVDTACAPTAYINSPDTIINCTGSPIQFDAIFGQSLNYEWNINGNPIQVGPTPTFNLSSYNNGDAVNVIVSNANCAATSNTIHVFTDATFTGLDSLYCDTAPAIPLSGVPSGGTFSGPGISGNMFDPNAAGVGVHIITYTYADTVSTCYYTASGCILNDTQYVTVDICTGIEEQNDFGNVSVYPNPNNSEFNVEFFMVREREVEINITDALGRNVYENNMQAGRGKHHVPVNLSSASEGIYFVFIKTESASKIYKVLVQE